MTEKAESPLAERMLRQYDRHGEAAMLELAAQHLDQGEHAGRLARQSGIITLADQTVITAEAQIYRFQWRDQDGAVRTPERLRLLAEQQLPDPDPRQAPVHRIEISIQDALSNQEPAQWDHDALDRHRQLVRAVDEAGPELIQQLKDAADGALDQDEFYRTVDQTCARIYRAVEATVNQDGKEAGQ